MNVEVTSVSKKSQRLSRLPAAIYVITQEEIRRSAATTIPELLRMAPGLDVARIDANQWAISARGFNGRWANKLPGRARRAAGGPTARQVHSRRAGRKPGGGLERPPHKTVS